MSGWIKKSKGAFILVLVIFFTLVLYNSLFNSLCNSFKPAKMDLQSEVPQYYSSAIADIYSAAAKCLTHADAQHVCRTPYSLDLVRALKVSDQLVSRSNKFKRSPFQFFRSNLSPQIGIKDLECRPENKKPVCNIFI